MRKPSLSDTSGRVDATALMLKTVSPPAKVEYLLAADRYVLDVLTLPYAAPAVCFDGTSSGITERQLGTVFAPGTVHARCWLTRSGDGIGLGVTQADSEIENTTSADPAAVGSSAAADVITVPCPQTGTASYCDVGSQGLQNLVSYASGDQIDDTPSATINRQLEVAEQLTPAVEDLQVSYVDALCVWPAEQSLDLETL